ncbi:MAG: bifunctional (p)ppGpp synthetase/guanosine-3',5'-bis(diphosphate) 3'-pyrophosphohydrolase [Hyphomonadaceae bacterium TMED5]|nr:bifunctional (p)ppGpp synthetase/guanosine-3',5'-bis(diphosphate) 3'-pyrophosphohydrolase [Ponticaulis sp.]OUY00697.1 MAG: bifunctional (p)ppGpp synthetase/guanosine-3',5'-bis(diphosphate) 3'-pyrophosphohydrolase [Hyphomonadaceae bacterium TMED5]|tara:strand:+ start:110717 stop:112957 length:2241 start_codon:yes stop_codon:yes gene_type:complete
MAPDGNTTPIQTETKPLLSPPVSAAPATFLRQYELVERVQAYAPQASEDQLNAAYVYAMMKHGTQKRASGDPYYSHPVSVAGILTELRLDEASIVAGLLHDTIEDTDATYDEIKGLFGEEVAELVAGVTKLSELEYTSEQSKQAENFQKFILASIQDLRVLLVKLADRLHNMRTIHFVPKEEKRKRISRETMEIYAPLARRVGVYKFAAELEDLSFRQLNPEAYSALQLRLKELRSRSEDDVERVGVELQEMVSRAGVEGRVVGRQKQPYSIWRKLKRKDISFRDVADIFAFRLILKEPADCYQMLGEVHQKWSCLQDRFRDYISMPKPNGYRSIHTTVRAAGNRRIELQIRTEDMNRTAETGIAAHWSYKNSKYGFDAEGALEAGLDPAASLIAFADMMGDGADAQEFYEHAKLEMYMDHVFAFTPKGRLIVLPNGAMPLDFAYAVHTNVGDSCTGCRINGETRPLRTELKNGDVVDIIRGENKKVVQGWEALTRTGRARSAIRRLIRSREIESYHALGQRTLAAALESLQLTPDQVNLDEIAHRLSLKDGGALLDALGRQSLDVGKVLTEAFPARAHEILRSFEAIRLNESTANRLIDIRDLPSGGALHLCSDCQPVLGDRIVGIQKKGEPITVHVIDCNRLADDDAAESRWFDLSWSGMPPGGMMALGRIKVTAHNRPGVMAELCTAIAESGSNIMGVNSGERSIDFMDLLFDIEVADLKHLALILASLRSLSAVDRAERIRN